MKSLFSVQGTVASSSSRRTVTTLLCTAYDSSWVAGVRAGRPAYLRRLFATGRRGGAAGGGQGCGAGLGGAFLPGRRHLVQAVLSGRVGLHAAGGRRVLGAKRDAGVYCAGSPSTIQCFSLLTNEGFLF